MASRHVVDLYVEAPSATITDLVRRSDAKQAIEGLRAVLQGVAGGSYNGSIRCRLGAAKASGTFTFSSVIATDTFDVNGVTFTCVSSGATGNQFNVGADDEESAANAAAAVNASATALVTDNVVATSSGAVVTITARYAGTLGNCITIADADSTITTSGARLTGGSDGTEFAFDLGLDD